MNMACALRLLRSRVAATAPTTTTARLLPCYAAGEATIVPAVACGGSIAQPVQRQKGVLPQMMAQHRQLHTSELLHINLVLFRSTLFPRLAAVSFTAAFTVSRSCCSLNYPLCFLPSASSSSSSSFRSCCLLEPGASARAATPNRGAHGHGLPDHAREITQGCPVCPYKEEIDYKVRTALAGVWGREGKGRGWECGQKR